MTSAKCVDEAGNTPFVRLLAKIFRSLGLLVAKAPWVFIVISTALTLIGTARIPFTPLTNDVSDYTPFGARARIELQQYKSFFSNHGTPSVVAVLMTSKRGNMYRLQELKDAVRVLDLVSDNFTVYNSHLKKHQSFSQFCNNFCQINEPVRQFYNAFTVNHGNGSESAGATHIDLGYPVTTVLGRQLRMDPNFFGVKVAIPSTYARGSLLNFTEHQHIGSTIAVDVNQLRVLTGHSIFDADVPQLPNNIHEIKVVGLQFRVERPDAISQTDFKQWERDIVDYIKTQFKSDYINVLVLTETHLTEEIVRAGLTLIPFLAIGFAIMVLFSSVTISLAAVYMNQMHVSKLVLAFMACVCPFMACGTALGLLFYSGIRFGTILCVTPFLVLAIGVDDAYLMLNSWQRIRKQNSSSTWKSAQKTDEVVSELVVEVFVDTAPSITITTLTNVLAFAVGAMTPTPEIQLFSIGNALAICVDYVYQWTVFGAFMAVAGRYEIEASNEPSRFPSFLDRIRARADKVFSLCIDGYCRLLTSVSFNSLVMALVGAYLYISVYGISTTRAELNPTRLFTPDSDVIRILNLRNDYIMPYYAVCLVFVNRPGNVSDASQVARWNSLVADFEGLPSSLGRFATKYWVRDYDLFTQNADDDDLRALQSFEEDYADSAEQPKSKSKNELRKFLSWPEFSYWNGFMEISDDQNENTDVDKFFFATASYGTELKDWSARARLLDEWRHVADSYPDLEVSIYEDEAKFLDLIPTMVPQTVQSSLWTFVCMVLVCLLVMTHPETVTVASFAILSTCLGVFGVLSLLGIELDPIVMSCGIMSIGFSVDIPAHIAYHFYRSGLGKSGEVASTSERLRHTLISVGFPVVEAGASTIACVMSMAFVNLHMAHVFTLTMLLVVVLGFMHGLVVIPVVFNLLSYLPGRGPKVAPAVVLGRV